MARLSRISYDAGFSRKVSHSISKIDPDELILKFLQSFVFLQRVRIMIQGLFHNGAIALPVSSQCINMHLKFIFGIEI